MSKSNRDRSEPKTAREKTARELMDELLKDPSYTEGLRRNAEKSVASAKRYGQDARGMLEDLRALGFDVTFVRDIRFLGRAYARAVPVLSHWLPLINNLDVKEDIIRTLSVPWAKPAAPLLVSQFERTSECESERDAGVRWAIGNALEVLASDDLADDLIRIATTSSYGKAREMVVLGLGKLDDPRAASTLISLLTDEAVVVHAMAALRKLVVRRRRRHLPIDVPREAVVPLLVNSWTRVRRDAKVVLDAIDRLPGSGSSSS